MPRKREDYFSGRTDMSLCFRELYARLMWGDWVRYAEVLKAICELASRMNKTSNYKKVQIKGPSDVSNLLMNELRFPILVICKSLASSSINIALFTVGTSTNLSFFTIS